MATNSQVVARNETLTRSISASGILPNSSVKTIKDYTLNTLKFLEKKTIGCSREHMRCEVKQGNNVVEMSTAAYELSKACIHELFNKESFPYYAERKDSMEQTGANVDSCYKIYNKKADG